jgi:hypothetical protein
MQNGNGKAVMKRAAFLYSDKFFIRIAIGFSHSPLICFDFFNICGTI